MVEVGIGDVEEVVVVGSVPVVSVGDPIVEVAVVMVEVGIGDAEEVVAVVSVPVLVVGFPIVEVAVMVEVGIGDVE